METSESESEGVYEKLKVTIDHKLLEAMVYFKDPKKRHNCAGRGQKGKKVKSGKRDHLSSLRGLSVEEQFLAYIKGASGFEWILEHSLVEVHVDLAREFFTSFHFTHTTDLDAPSICFRLFNQEILMTLREWSLCLGLLTP